MGRGKPGFGAAWKEKGQSVMSGRMSFKEWIQFVVNHRAEEGREVIFCVFYPIREVYTHIMIFLSLLLQ